MTTKTAVIDLELIQTGDVLMISHDRNRLSVKAVRSDDRITAAALNVVSTDISRRCSDESRSGPLRLARLHPHPHRRPHHDHRLGRLNRLRDLMRSFEPHSRS